MSDGSGIRIRGLSKRFGAMIALDSLDLEVGGNEIVSLLGPNGAGKSTLMRILSTTVLPDSGTASICGADVLTDVRTALRHVGVMIGDERSFYWRLTGHQNLKFFAALQGMKRREAATRAAQLLETVGIADSAHRPVRNYSSGMRARLSLARAMLIDPPMLLLDEPTRSLDPLAASGFRDTALRLAGEHGTGILIATHDLHEAVEISDRIDVLSAGRKVLEAPAQGMKVAALEAAFLDAVREHEIDHEIGLER